MRKLTIQEEYDMIDEFILDKGFIAEGSSRAVFKGPEGFVIKIAKEEAGRVQNFNELMTFKEHGNSGFFGEITYYGDFILVMEEMVDIHVDFNDMAWGFFYETEYDFSMDNIREYFLKRGYEEEHLEMIYNRLETYKKIYDYMDNVMDNHSADNFQIGLTPDGYKMYDYGYNSKSSFDSQVPTEGVYVNDLRPASIFREWLESDVLWERMEEYPDHITIPEL